MSTTVVHLPPPSQKRAFLLMLARALQIRHDGGNVVTAHCALAAGTCASNLTGSRLVCAACKHASRRSVQGTGLELIPLAAPGDTLPEPDSPAAPHQTDDVDSDSFDAPIAPNGYREAAELADGVNSCLVTVLRVMMADVNRIGVLRAIKRRYFASCRRTLAAVRSLLSDEKYAAIETLNGRYACTKVGIIAARECGKKYSTLDFNLTGRPMVFDGFSPHDRLAVQRRVLENEADLAAADEYYAARQSGRINAFAKSHDGFEPPIADHSGRKLTFFLSSQDECESLGPSWRSPFRDVAGTIRAAAERYPNDFFTVRFHPNQASILSDVCRPFEGLSEIPNVRLYWPEDKIDSYSLIAWSDAVITFASTVAIESCWMDKPVFQLGPSYFDQLGISYTPKDLDEFLDELAGPLRSFPKENAARYAKYETGDFNSLDFLDSDETKTIPIGFSRKGSAFAKPAKEWNNAVVAALKKLSKSQLAKRRAA